MAGDEGMGTLERPALRPLHAQRFDHEGQSFVALEDPLGAAPNPVLVPLDGFHLVVRRFDGKTTLNDIQIQILRETGQLIPTTDLRGLVERLDQAMMLDGPTFAAFLEGYRGERTRSAFHAGRSYAKTERALRAQLNQYFLDSQGAGEPVVGRDRDRDDSGTLRGIISPHIDFHRGGTVYTWAYKELAERSQAEVFVILGVAHQYCRHRFALTYKDFETPLGLARTDRDYVDRIASLTGRHLFEDELSHRVEHSIEFQVVFLQHLLGGRRDFSIVPILVGSFHDLMALNLDPMADDEVQRFVQALQAAESACPSPVTYIAGIDLCHVGPEFGDPNRLDASTLETVRDFDAAMLEKAASCDAPGWFATASEVDNRWRVCGLAATYTMLQAMGPSRGRLLKYNQAVNPERTCGVTFASLAFESND